MVYDGKAHYMSTKHMLDQHNISQKTWSFYRKRHPKLTARDLLDVVCHNKKKNR